MIRRIMKFNTKESMDFWDKAAKKYSLKPVPNNDIYEKKLRKTQEYFQKESLVLELGCGTGTTSLIHAPFVKHIDACDFSCEMIQIANEKKSQQKISNVSFEVKSVDDFQIKEDYYDVIMAHSLLHLISDNKTILKKVFQSLKREGIFVTSSGCMKDMPIFLRVILPLLKLIGFAPYVNFFSGDELIDLHKNVGFSIDYEWRYKKGEIFLIAKKN